MKKYRSKIAVIIPCYNECKTIANVIKDYRNALQEADIYVIDNNSTDGTDKIAKENGAIVLYEYRQGKGNAVKYAFRSIKAECYLMVDGDDTYPADKALEMCNLVLEEKADMVIGDRLSSTYFVENKRKFHGFGNRLVRWLINFIFRSDIKDVMTGSRAFSYEFVKGFPLISKGYELETELTIYALDRNYKIATIPVSYKDRVEDSFSKLNTFSDGMKVLHTIGRLFKEYKPVTFFNFFAIILLLISFLLIIPVLVEYSATGLVPRFPTLIVSGFFAVAAIILWACGIILGVINKKHRELYELYLNQLD
ncbi:MAG: glycosyltransferase family 2 protein [Bacilli bacterium]|nr:glycosyltransferase family 2 protein [Bacilli bacterium]